MINLNLLPWRESLKQRYQRRFYLLIAGITLAAFMAVLIEYLFVSSALDHQLARNIFLQNNVDKLQQEIDALKRTKEAQAPIMKQLNFFASLNNNRFQVVHFLGELPRILPEGVHLTKIEYDGKHVNLDGEAQNNSEILLFMKKITQSASMSEPVLESIVSTHGEKQFKKSFEIALQLK